ncbi:MAG: hypothetical protein DBX58_06335 [Clostridiales bacterium]|nr:MAG: hypothetical protein DBX58_06335 [Clostridiales bacterium]
MTKNEMELIYNIEKEKEKVLKAEALKPFLKDRTLLYGYTCERKTCDYTFCKLLKRLGIELPFTTYNEDRPKANFYGFTLEDAECTVSGKAQTVLDHSVENFKKGFVSDEIKLDEF